MHILKDKYHKEIDFVFEDFIKTSDERKLLDETYEVIELKKGDNFLREGDSWYKFGFLLKGSLYSHVLNDEGEKEITGFYYYPQNYIVVDYETFVLETKIAMTYTCFEDSVILNFDGVKFNRLFDYIPGINKTRLKLAEDRYFKSLNVIRLLQSTNANDKVQELYDQSPELFTLFPYSYLASYLGMHRNTYRRAIKHLKT